MSTDWADLCFKGNFTALHTFSSDKALLLSNHLLLETVNHIILSFYNFYWYWGIQTRFLNCYLKYDFDEWGKAGGHKLFSPSMPHIIFCLPVAINHNMSQQLSLPAVIPFLNDTFRALKLQFLKILEDYLKKILFWNFLVK